MERDFAGNIFRNFQEIPRKKDKICGIEEKYRFLGRLSLVRNFWETFPSPEIVEFSDGSAIDQPFWRRCIKPTVETVLTKKDFQEENTSQKINVFFELFLELF